MTCLYSRSCRPTRWLGEGSIVPPRSYKWDRLVPAAPVVAARLPSRSGRPAPRSRHRFAGRVPSLAQSLASSLLPRPRHGNKSLQGGAGRRGCQVCQVCQTGLGRGFGLLLSKTGQTCDRTKLTKLTVPSLAPASRVELRTCPEWGQATFFLGGGKWVVSFVRFVSRLLGPSGSFWCNLSTKTRRTCDLTDLTNLTTASRTPGRQQESSRRGRTTGLSGLSDGAWAGIWAFVTAKLAKHATGQN